MTRSARSLHTPLFLLALLFTAWQTPACTEVSCEETRTCGSPAQPGTAGEGGTSSDTANPQGGTGNGAGRVTAAIGDACPTNNARACPGPASSSVLLCDDGLWTLLRNCSAGERCDSRDPECEPIVPACASLAPNATYCDASTLYQCGPDKVTTTALQDCALGCAAGACVGAAGANGAGGDSGIPETPSEGGTAGSADGIPSDGGTAGAIPLDPEDPCSAQPCENGSCVVVGDAYQCTCDDGYEGDNCETNIDDCAPNPCENGGRCDDLVAGYECVCGKTFTGVNCELPRFQIIEPLVEHGWVEAYAVSGDGRVVVGTFWTPQDESRGFRWEDGVFELVAPLEPNTETNAKDISQNGSVIIGYSGDRVVRWTSNGPEPLPEITGSTLSRVNRVSADGSVVIGSTTFGVQETVATIWRGSSVSLLDDNRSSYALGVSEDGSVVGGWRKSGDVIEAMRWTASRADVLPSLAGSLNCGPYVVDRTGSKMAGYCLMPDNVYRGVRWVGDVIEELGMPPERLLENAGFWASAMTNDGAVIIGQAKTQPRTSELPIIWDAEHGARWLVPLLEECGFDSTAYWWGEPSWPNDISNDGKVIVGSVWSDEGLRAFIARLP
jgi:probable HAF family extracellular repeat protein